MKLGCTATLLLLGITIGGAQAQPVGELTREYASCTRSAPSEVEKTRCLAQELERQEALLDVEVKLATKGIEPDLQNRLKRTQEAWNDYRMRDCQTKRAAINGSGQSQAYFDCMLYHTVIRKQQMPDYWAF